MQCYLFDNLPGLRYTHTWLLQSKQSKFNLAATQKVLLAATEQVQPGCDRVRALQVLCHCGCLCWRGRECHPVCNDL